MKTRKIEILKANKKKPIIKCYFFILSQRTPIGVYTSNNDPRSGKGKTAKKGFPWQPGRLGGIFLYGCVQ